nr:cyclic nucleotide-binding domain-containing protein [Alphaproteobacteria bacterium]
GKRQHIAYILPHQIVGEIALIDNFPRTASVVAVEPSEAEVMDRVTFQMCMKDSNPFIIALLRVLSSRYRSLVSKLGVIEA